MNIYNLSFSDLQNCLKANNIASFRAIQIWDWLYKKYVTSFDDMKNLDKKTLNFLKENFHLHDLKLIKLLEDHQDGTKKALLELNNNKERIETVLMLNEYGYTICVTTQIGCRIGCSFCASHLGGLKRNLESGEIVQQIIFFNKLLAKENKRIKNVVIMGIGEPLDNYDNVIKFIDIINDHNGLDIGARRITLSTSGIVPKIYDIANYNKQINLAISLHAPNNQLRSKIMKINNAYPLEKLMKAIEFYINKTNRRVSLEYIMLEGINDSKETALELANLVKNRNIHINLIPFNKVDDYDYKKSATKIINHFKEILEQNHINVTIRQSKGQNIDGACGQLRNKYEN